MSVNSKNMAETDPVQTFTSLFDEPIALNKTPLERAAAPTAASCDDSVDEEEDDDGNINAIIFGANKLNPNFLLIDDEDHDQVDVVGMDATDENDSKKKSKKSFLVDDDELTGYNDTIDLNDDSFRMSQHNLSRPEPIKNPARDSWSLSTSSSNSSASSNSLSSLSNRAEKLSVKDQNKLQLGETICEQTQSTLSFSSQTTSPSSLVDQQTTPVVDLFVTDEENFKLTSSSLVTSPLFVTPNVVPQQSSSSTSSSFSSLSCPNTTATGKTLASFMSAANLDPKNSYDVLNLLDVSHLIEYQATTSNPILGAATSALPTPHSNILRGGHIDALIVLATSAQTGVVSAASSVNLKSSANSLGLTTNNNHSASVSNSLLNASSNLNSHMDKNNQKNNFLFQEAFLTTYRTIIEPIDLVNKLIYRYRYFSKYSSSAGGAASKPLSGTPNWSQFAKIDDKFDFNRIKLTAKKNKLAMSAAKNSLALLVRVLDDLGYFNIVTKII